MKSHCFFRQILISVLIVMLFSIGLIAVLFLIKDAPAEALSAYGADGLTAFVFRSESEKTSADCPLYSLGDHTYLALFDGSCRLSCGVMEEIRIVQSGGECEIIYRAKKETLPIENAERNQETYEFFGGEISFYPCGNGWVCAILLMNQAADAAYERIWFGTIEMTAKEYREAYPKDPDGLFWDAENEVYTDEETGNVYQTRTAHAFETPVLCRKDNKDAYVCFYLSSADYACIMQDKGFTLPDTNGGHMSAIFWEKE